MPGDKRAGERGGQGGSPTQFAPLGTADFGSYITKIQQSGADAEHHAPLRPAVRRGDRRGTRDLTVIAGARVRLPGQVGNLGSIMAASRPTE
jgi:hypothetical protein